MLQNTAPSDLCTIDKVDIIDDSVSVFHQCSGSCTSFSQTCLPYCYLPSPGDVVYVDDGDVEVADSRDLRCQGTEGRETRMNIKII